MTRLQMMFIRKNKEFDNNFYLVLNVISHGNLMKKIDKYYSFMKSPEGSRAVTSKMRDIDVCAISATPSKTIPIPINSKQNAKPINSSNTISKF